MSRRIAIIQGHPDPRGDRYGHALAGAYAEGTTAAGHEVRTIDLARLRETLTGAVEASAASRERWLAKLRALGGRGE